MVHPVIGKHSGPKSALVNCLTANKANRLDQAIMMVDEWYAQNIFDAYWLGIQFIHEADMGHSPIWTARLNPAGLGVTDGEDQGISYKNGQEAARGILIHHAAYTGITLPEAWKSWLPLDPRYQLAKDKFGGRVTNWEDYGNGLWATDTKYWQGLWNRYTQVQQYNTGDTTNMPNIIDKYLHVAQDGYAAVNRRYIGRFGMSPKIIVLHIQEGNNWGSWQHFHVVSASSTVLIGKNGDIWRLVPESDSPWTNGDVAAPSAKGWAVINKFGADPNVYSLTIETEGFTGEWPKDQRQLDSVVWQIKTWMEKYNIPIEYVLRHADINSVSRPNCPGNAFFNYVISKLQNVTPKPTYSKVQPVLVDGVAWDGTKDVTINGKTFYANVGKVHTNAVTPVLVFATKDSAKTRTDLAKGTEVSVLGWVTGEAVNNETRWWITKGFSRINASYTIEKPVKPAPVDDADVNPDLPDEVKYFRGKVYYPVGGDIGELTITAKAAHLRQEATTKSRDLGIVKRGDKVKAVYWTFGQEVNEESVWWVLENAEGKEPLKHGPRLWVSATSERPD
jgi:hypothetical protein